MKAATKKFKRLEDFTDRLVDLSETERQQQETANEISETLQYFVDEQNDKATGYKNKFRDRVKEKLEHKIRKKYFPGMKKEEVLVKALKDDELSKALKAYHKELSLTDINKDRRGKKTIFEDLKRVFNKELTRHGGSDIDKEAGLFLLNLVGFYQDEKREQIRYNRYEVEHGHRGKKWLTFDTWGTRDGLEIVPTKQMAKGGKHAGKTNSSLFNALAVIDEHNKQFGTYTIKPRSTMKPTSSTHIIYKLLEELSMINPRFKDQIKRFVDFVDKADSLHYQIGGIDQQAKNRTLFSLHWMIPIRNIYKYFENPQHTGFEVLKDNELKELGIENIEKIEDKNIQYKKQLMELDDKGRFWNFNNERFIFAKGDEFKGGQRITSYYDAWLFQIFESGDLYMYSHKDLPENIAGFSTDWHFLIIKKIKVEDLKKILEMFEFWKYAEPWIIDTFLNYRKDQIAKEEKKERVSRLDEKQRQKELKGKEAKIADTENKDDFKIGKEYNGIVNRIDRKIMYVRLNKSDSIRWMLKVEDKKTLTAFWEGDLVRIKIIGKPEDKAMLTVELTQS